MQKVALWLLDTWRDIMADAPSSWREIARKRLEDLKADLTEQIETEGKEIAENAKNDRALYPPSPAYYWTMVFLYVVAQLALGIYAVTTLTDNPLFVGIPVNTGVVILLLQALHIIGSVRSIGVNDLAGFSFFGRPWYIPKTGPYIVPLWVLTLIRTDRNYKDKRFPGPADKIYRISKEMQEKREGGDVPPAGMVRPIFVTTGEPSLTENDKKVLKETAGNPLDRQLSVEISYSIRYRADQEHGGVFRIARSLSTRIENIDDRITDLVQEQSARDMKSILSLLTPATIIENWVLVNEVFILKTRLGVMRLGVNIDTKAGGLDDINASHATNEAQADVSREQFKKLATITRAEGERERLAREGEGRGKAEQSRLEGLARGYKKIKENIGVDGASVLAAETAKDSLGKANTIVVGTSGVKELFGLVAAGKERFSNQEKKEGA